MRAGYGLEQDIQTPITPASSEVPIDSEAKPLKAETKQALTSAGINAGAGLLMGLASALLASDEPDPKEDKNALPSGNPGSVKGSMGSQMSYGRQDLPTRQSFALELLRRG